MNIRTLIIVLAGLGVAITLIFTRNKQNTGTKKYTLGIIQTISHPALDSVKNAITSELEAQLGTDVACEVQNAEGSLATAQTIAKSMHQDAHICAIATIGTLATQATMLVEKNKPIIYSAVSDPAACGITSRETNITGVSDTVDVPASLDALCQLCPEAKTIAIMHNPSEPNSCAIVKKMDTALKTRKLIAQHITITNETEVLPATQSSLKDCDALWLPTDNTIACVMSVVGKSAWAANKPVIICDKNLVSPGILATAGSTDYKLCGKKAARMLVRIIRENISPANITPEIAPSPEICVHEPTQQKLGIRIPETLSKKIVFVKN